MTKKCSVDGCEQTHEALGLCRKHYDAEYRLRYAAAHPEYADQHRARSLAHYHRTKFGAALAAPPAAEGGE